MATIPSEITWVSGQVVTAAQLNSNLRDAVNFLINLPVVELQQTVAQSIPNSAFTAITWNSEQVNNDGMHSTSTNPSRITAVTTGRYLIASTVAYSSNTTGRRLTGYFINGSQLAGGQYEIGTLIGGGNDTPITARTRQIFLNVNDYVEVQTLQTSGGALNTGVDANNQSDVTCRWVGTT